MLAFCILNVYTREMKEELNTNAGGSTVATNNHFYETTVFQEMLTVLTVRLETEA